MIDLFKRRATSPFRCAFIAAVVAGLTTVNAHGNEAAGAPQSGWSAGFARVVITPDEPIWMTGYGGRTKPAEGKVHELYARAAAFNSPDGKTALFMAMDLLGVSAGMQDVVTTAAKEKHGIQRANVMLASSHTHCGPALDDKISHMLAMNEDDWKKVRANQKTLNRKLVEVMDAAVKDLKPAKLFAGNGACGFAVNRRAPIGEGPVDHVVPVLKVTAADGKTLRGVIFGYACHNTTLSFYNWCGDYAGFAQLDLEDRHDGAVALFFTGCGADQNPLPRRTVELCQMYGRMLSTAVNEVLGSNMTPVEGGLRTGFESIELAFDTLPSREEVARQLKEGNRYEQARAKLLLAEFDERGALQKTHPYPVQVWRLGDKVLWTALGGEVVVDYSLRLRKELDGAAPLIWTTGYANHVMSYIPSERVLKEGGYEGERSMVYYQLPTKWKPGLEDQIVETVKRLVKVTETTQ